MKLPKRFRNIVPLFVDIIRRHQKLSYGRLLQWHCPLPDFMQERRVHISLVMITLMMIQARTSREWHVRGTALNTQDPSPSAPRTQPMEVIVVDSETPPAIIDLTTPPPPLDHSHEENTAQTERIISTSTAASMAQAEFIEKLPTPVHSAETAMNGGAGVEYSHLINASTTPTQVTQFICAVLRRIIPRAVWGSAYNENIIMEGVGMLMRLRRYERLPLSMVINGFKTSHMTWLRSSDSHEHVGPEFAKASQEASIHLIWWVLNGIVVPLIRVLFYATESAGNRNCVFFYRYVVLY